MCTEMTRSPLTADVGRGVVGTWARGVGGGLETRTVEVEESFPRPGPATGRERRPGDEESPVLSEGRRAGDRSQGQPGVV